MYKISLVFFGDTWDDSWRRRQQIAFHLSKREELNTVIYIEHPLTLTSFGKNIFGLGDLDSRRRWKRVRNKGFSFTHGKIKVVTPFYLTPIIKSRAGEKINRFHGRFFIQRLRHEHISNGSIPIVWVSHPFINWQVIRDLPRGKLFYDCTEGIGRHGFCLNSSAKHKKMVEENENKIMILADEVIFNSKTALSFKQHICKKASLCINGIEEELIRKLQKLSDSKFNILNSIPQPIAGYLGNFTSKIDINLVRFLAKKRPDVSFVFLGNLWDENRTLNDILNIRNVFFIGNVPYYQLPEYINSFDVCLSIYNIDEGTLTATSSKLLLYLASGKPIVSTNTSGVDNFGDAIYVANDHRHFLELLDTALKKSDGEKVEERIAFASQNTWEKKVDLIIRMMVA